MHMTWCLLLREGDRGGEVTKFNEFLLFYFGEVVLRYAHAHADVLYGRREQILQRRKEVRIQTINRRRDYNRDLRELVNAA
jgi:hypothetical protein